MSPIRDKIMQALWRGEDPFSSYRYHDGDLELPPSDGLCPRYLAEAIATLRPSIIVAAGVTPGASVIPMAAQLRELGVDGVVIAVDTFQGSWRDWIAGQPLSADRALAAFLHHVSRAELQDYVVPLPLDTLNAAPLLRHFALFPEIVQLEAQSDHAAVITALRQWWPLLAAGGRLIGNGYRAGNAFPDVKRAFDDYFRPLGLLPLEHSDGQCLVPKPLPDLRANDRLAALRRIGKAVADWREIRRLEHVELYEKETIGFENRLGRFLRWEGPNWEPGLVRIINRIAKDWQPGSREFNRNDLFGPRREIRPEANTAIPGYGAHFLNPAPANGFAEFELLAERENRYRRFALPPGLGKNLPLVKAPPLTAYRVDGADLFLTPLGFQLYRANEGIYWPIATSRPYPHEAIQGPHITVKKCVVLVQDVFEGTNFCHFLYRLDAAAWPLSGRRPRRPGGMCIRSGRRTGRIPFSCHSRHVRDLLAAGRPVRFPRVSANLASRTAAVLLLRHHRNHHASRAYGEPAIDRDRPRHMLADPHTAG